MKVLLELIFAFFASVAVLAQGSGRLPLRTFGRHEGLVSSAINAICQDDRGLLWIGTEIGLQRYDGRILQPVALPGVEPQVLSLAAEGHRLWVGTLRGLTLIEDGIQLARPAGFPADWPTVTHLQVAPDGQVWFLCGGRPWRGTATAVGEAGSLPGALPASGLYVDPDDGRVLLCAQDRLWGFMNGAWRSLDRPPLARGELLLGAARDGAGRTWLRSTRGAWSRAAGGPWQFRPLAPAGGYPVAVGLGRNADGSVWFSAGATLARALGDRWEPLADPGLGPVSVALLDREGSLWIAAGNLFQVMGQGLWHYWNTADGLPSPLTWQVLRDHQGRMWAASDQGLALGGGQGWRVLVAGKFRRMAMTADGTVWAGRADLSLLYRIRPGSRTPEPAPGPIDPSAGLRIESLAAQAGDVWILAGDSLWRGRPGPIGLDWSVQPHPFLGHLRILLEDGQGGLFLAGDQGLAAREGEAWIPVQGLEPGRRVLSLARSRTGTLAVAYDGSGSADGAGGTGPMPIFRQEAGVWRLQRTLDPLPGAASRLIYAVAFDRMERLWVGTNLGLFRVQTDRAGSMQAYVDGEGLMGSDVSHQSLLFDPDGRLWVCTANAVCCFESEAERPVQALPAPVLLAASTGTRALPGTGPWDLAAGDRLQLAFALPTFLHPESLSFHALLDDGHRVSVLDLDRPWLDLPGLGAGAYRITLLGQLADQGRGPGTSFQAAVHPPLWARSWALLGYAVIAGIVGVAVHLSRQASLRRRAEGLEALVGQRTEEVILASQAKSEFLAHMSHELRTPLNAILLYSELMQEEAREAGLPRGLADAQKVQAAGRHLLSLIDNILDLAKIESGRMVLELQDVELGPFLADLEGALRPLLEHKGNRFRIHLDPDLHRLRTDPVRLRQILSNLLSNAGKFTEEGEVELTATRVGGDRVFTVRDTGIGMTEDQVRTVFDSFVQADTSITRRFGGTGLGLALVRHLTGILGGSVQVASVLGKGSTFTVRFPPERDQT